ncbi:MAG: universal stress protein [Leptolyngbya sp.]|nr:universal stress protein [Candidatus Melainabacteria bacterium]
MKVLIAVNDPDYAREITAFVLKHSWAPETEFRVLAVNEDIRIGSLLAFLPGPILDDLMLKTQDLENQVLEDTAKALTQNMENMIVSTKISKGFPKEEILLEIKEWQPDVLFVGSHGRKGLDRVLLGSVSQYLVSNAPC